jgi:outer membrane protein assembly factor BamB
VFVTGYSNGTSSGEDYATVAYSAATGDQLWVKRYNGPANATDEANSVGVSPDGRKVFVTGVSAGATSPDYATVAYNAATGAKLWVKRYDGPAKKSDAAWSLALSPDGTKAYVTGGSTGTKSSGDYTTVAYNAATGAQLWLKRYNGPANSSDSAYSVAVSPDGRKVVVTGASTGIYYPDGSEKGFDYATVAYNASTGAQLWAKRYNGPAKDKDMAHSVTVGPASSAVYVTGESTGTNTGSDYATVAYNAATGARLWDTRYNGQANGIDAASSVAVSPDGQTVYVTGESTEIPPTSAQSYEGYATFAYSAATGVPLWASRYNGTGIGYNYAASIAVSPATGTVFVTGLSDGTDASNSSAVATIAYQS